MSTFANFHDQREENIGKASKYQKWDYITLSDFRSSSCGKVFSYIWLWILAIISVAVYAADTFTAVNLLVYDRWSSQVDPVIPFRISKWIFAACIIFSWVLCLVIEWPRAIRIIHRRNVAESYLDPLAVTLQSIRDGNGWRRFLVFAELTKSRKGADYVALFSYFNFKGAIRVVAAEGPRQVINALTLYSVMRAQLIPVGQHAASDGHTPIVQFFYNIKILADEHTEQAVILFSMLFTLIIWIFSALSLAISCILFITFLWHYIPSEDGTLPRYCRRKIDKRLEKIVSVKIEKALKKQDDERKKLQEKAAALEANGFVKAKAHEVTVKDLGLLDLPLSRRTTDTSMASTLAAQPGARPTRQERLAAQQPSLDSVKEVTRPGLPTRTATDLSTATTSTFDGGDDRPLLQHKASMGRSEPVAVMGGSSQHAPYDPMKPLPIMPGENDYEKPGYTNNKPYPMPGAYDYEESIYSTRDDDFWQASQAAPTMQDPYELPSGRLTERSQYGIPSAARPYPARLPSYRDFSSSPADALLGNFGRQASLSSQYGPPPRMNSFGQPPPHPMDGRAAAAPVQRRPYPPTKGNRSYSPFGAAQGPPQLPYPDFQSPQCQPSYTHDPTTGLGVPVLSTPTPPKRSNTMPQGPSFPAATYSPPRRVGTAPPNTTMTPPTKPVQMPPSYVFELDAGEASTMQAKEDEQEGDEEVVPQSRFNMGIMMQRKLSERRDEESGYEHANGYAGGDSRRGRYGY